MKLELGMKVRIKRSKDYAEDAGKVKKITGYVDYGEEQGYRLNNEAGIYLAIDFDQNYNS